MDRGVVLLKLVGEAAEVIKIAIMLKHSGVIWKKSDWRLSEDHKGALSPVTECGSNS